MLQFNDPGTIFLAASTGFSALQSIGEGAQAKAQADAEAKFLENQAQLERVQSARDVRDEKERTRRAVARSRAVLAAQGVSLASNVGVSTVADVEGQSLIRQRRIASDTENVTASLQAKAANKRTAGKRARRASFVKAGVQVFGGASKISDRLGGG